MVNSLLIMFRYEVTMRTHNKNNASDKEMDVFVACKIK